MTVVCGGGPSGPKAGVAATVVYGLDALVSLFSRRGAPWLLVLAPLLGVLSYETQQFCATDPPPDPDLTAADVAAILALNDLGATATALAKVADLAKIAIWYELCQCTSVATPTAPIGPFVPPPNLPTPQPSSALPCWSRNLEIAPPRYIFPALDPDNNEINQLLLPAMGTQAVTRGPSGDNGLTASILPTPLYSAIDFRGSILSPSPTNSSVSTTVTFWTSSGVQAGSPSLPTMRELAPYTINAQRTIIPPTNAYSVTIQTIYQGAVEAVQVAYTLQAYCEGSPTSGAPTTCATDPQTMALLQQILQMITLVQRQAAPFGYVPGAVHPGLFGHGELTVYSLLGVTVDLTLVPNWYGYSDGNPDRHHDLGWLSVGTADGWQQPVRITTDGFYLKCSGEITRIGYTLSPGVIATITERKREP